MSLISHECSFKANIKNENYEKGFLKFSLLFPLRGSWQASLEFRLFKRNGETEVEQWFFRSLFSEEENCRNKRGICSKVSLALCNIYFSEKNKNNYLDLISCFSLGGMGKRTSSGVAESKWEDKTNCILFVLK